MNVLPAALAEFKKAVPPPAPKRTAQQQTKAQQCSQLRGKVDMMKQLEKEYLEVGSKVEEARGMIMQPTPLSEVASSGMAVDAELLLPRNIADAGPCQDESEAKSAKRLPQSVTGDEAPSVQQVLAAQNTFSVQDLGSMIRSIQQRQQEMEEEEVERDQCGMDDAVELSG